MKILKFLAFTYLIFSIILFSYLIIFEIRDILFPNGMKPIKPTINFDKTIKYLTLSSIFVRIFSITFIFFLLYYTSSYEFTLKETILSKICNNNENFSKLNNINNENISRKYLQNKNHQKSFKDDVFLSLNNHDSNYTTGTSEDKNIIDETIIRVNMDELNEKIKAGEIFNDNKSRV